MITDCQEGTYVFLEKWLHIPIGFKNTCKNAAKNYIAETYDDRDFIIEEVNYSFKDMGYYAHVKTLNVHLIRDNNLYLHEINSAFKKRIIEIENDLNIEKKIGLVLIRIIITQRE